MSLKIKNHWAYLNAQVQSNNLAILEKRFPHVWKQIQTTVDATSSSQPVDMDRSIADGCGGFDFLRGDEPIVAAKRVIAGWHFKPYDTLFLIGMGLGNLPLEMVTASVGKPRVVIIEPLWQVFRQALYEVDLRPLFSDERIDIFLGPNIDVFGIIEKYRQVIPIGRNQIVVHPNYDKIHGEKIGAIKQELSDRIRIIRDGWYTTKKHGRKMLANAIINLPSLLAGTPFRTLRNQFDGIPTICIAAGPSLDTVIHELAYLREHALLIACDSAVNSLLNAGIEPHIVVTTDIFESNVDKIRSHVERLRDAVLIFGVESNPDNVRLYLGERRAAVTAHNKLLSNWLEPVWDLQCSLPGMSSVSHLAVFTAMALGAGPIVLSGIDLAYSDGHSHASGSVYYHSTSDKKEVFVGGSNGAKILSSPQFVADKLLFEKHIANASVPIINTCLNGAYINGTKLKSVSEIVSLFANKKYDIQKRLNAIPWNETIDQKSAAVEIEKLIVGLDEFLSRCDRHAKSILEKKDSIEEEPNSQRVQQMLLTIRKADDFFSKDNSGFINILHDTMLDDVQYILQQKACIAVKKYDQPDGKVDDEIELVLTYNRALKKAGTFLADQLSTVHRYLLRAVKLVSEALDRGERSTVNIHLGHFFRENHQIWRAVQTFEACQASAPDDPLPHMELFNTYENAGLWSCARNTVASASTIMPDRSEIKSLQTEFDRYVDGRFEEMKNKWMSGDMGATRILLNEFLSLRPDDPQANELKRVIGELDREFSGDWVESQVKIRNEDDFQKRLNQAASYLAQLEFEPAIGMLYGLIADYPSQSAAFYEKIGDCRMLQNDFLSAGWNYSRAAEMAPGIPGLAAKIKDAYTRASPAHTP